MNRVIAEWKCGFCQAKNATTNHIRTCYVCGLIPIDAYQLAQEMDKQIEEDEDMEWERAAN